MKFLDREYHNEERDPFQFTFISWFEKILGKTLDNKITKDEIYSRKRFWINSDGILRWLEIYQAIKFDELLPEIANTITKTIADIPKIYDRDDWSREDVNFNLSGRATTFISLVLAFYSNYQNKSGIQENAPKKWSNACVSVEANGEYVPIYSLYEWIKKECVWEKGEVFLKQFGVYSSITAELVRGKHISVVFDECFNDLIFVATKNSHTVTGIYIVSLANGKYRCQYDTEDLCLIAFSPFSNWMKGMEPFIDINEVSTMPFARPFLERSRFVQKELAFARSSLGRGQSVLEKFYKAISNPTQNVQKFYSVITDLLLTADAIDQPNNPKRLPEKIALMAIIVIHLIYGDIAHFPYVVWRGIAEELEQNSRELRNKYPDLKLPIYIASCNGREIKLSEVRDNFEETIVSLRVE